MSRSVKKYPGGGHCGSSEKDDKRHWHRRFRRIQKQAIFREQEVMPHFRDVSNPWSMSKDGKQFWPKPTEKEYANIYQYLGRWAWHGYYQRLETPEKILADKMATWERWMRK